MTKSTSADTKPGKRAKKEVEEVKQPAAKKVKRNRTNLQDAKLIEMCKQLDIDISNIDPNDMELKAILMAACNEEQNSPIKKGKGKDVEDEQDE